MEAQRGTGVPSPDGPQPTVWSRQAGSRPFACWPQAPSRARPGREGRLGSLALILLAAGPRKGPREGQAVG